MADSTEVIHSEEKSGGLKYEVVLSEAKAEHTPNITASPARVLSREDVVKKLEAAEQRRKSIEASKIATLQEKFNKIKEASKKKNEQMTEQMNQLAEILNQKMEIIKEKREAQLEDHKKKLKEHHDNVCKVRDNQDVQIQQLKAAIEEKLKVATEVREENLKKISERVKQHEVGVEQFRKSMDDKEKQLEAQIAEKLEMAEKKREQELEKRVENLRKHNSEHLVVVRNVNEANWQESRDRIERELREKLEKADVNRLQSVNQMKEKLTERKRHVEEVRQNKASVPEQTTETASSA